MQTVCHLMSALTTLHKKETPTFKSLNYDTNLLLANYHTIGIEHDRKIIANSSLVVSVSLVTDLLSDCADWSLPIVLWPAWLAHLSSNDCKCVCLPCLFSCVRVIMLPSSAKPFSRFSRICWGRDIYLMMHINCILISKSFLIWLFTQMHLRIWGWCVFLWGCSFMVWTLQSMHILILIHRLYGCTNSKADRS